MRDRGQHKLLKLEKKGADLSAIASIENYACELASAGQPYPTPGGLSTQGGDAGFGELADRFMADAADGASGAGSFREALISGSHRQIGDSAGSDRWMAW